VAAHSRGRVRLRLKSIFPLPSPPQKCCEDDCHLFVSYSMAVRTKDPPRVNTCVSNHLFLIASIKLIFRFKPKRRQRID